MRVACFCPVFMYTAKSGNRYTFLPESPFYTLLPGATFLGQNHMRVPCFRPVFMYTANVGCTRAKSGYRYTFFPESPFHTLLPGICYLLISHHSHITMIPEPKLCCVIV